VFVFLFVTGRLTIHCPELQKGQLPVIVRANRTVFALDRKNRLVELNPPQDDEDDDDTMTRVNLRFFGPTFATIPAEGDGMDSQNPLPPIKPKRAMSTKKSKDKSSTKSSKRGHQKAPKGGKKKRSETRNHESDMDDGDVVDDGFLTSSSDDGRTQYDTDSSGTDIGDEKGLSTLVLLVSL
jgi:hypothetical protein